MYKIKPTRLREARREKQLTLSDVAEKIKKDRSTICRYETGKTNMSLEMALRLTQLYGVGLDDIMEQ